MYFSFAIKLLQVVLQFVVQFLLVSLVTKSIYGSYSFVVAVIGIVAIITQMGLPELTMREVARAVAQGAHWAARPILQLSGGLFAVNIAMLVCLATVFRSHFPESFTALIPIWPQILTILLAAGTLRIIAGYYRGLGHYILGLSAESVMFPAVFLVAVVAVGSMPAAFGGLEVSVLVKIHAFAILLLAMGIAGKVLFSRCVPRSQNTDYILPEPRQQFFAASVIGAQTGASILFTYVDVLMLTVLADLPAVAEYRLAAQLAQLAVLVNLALIAFFAPRIAAAYRTGDRIEVRRIVQFAQIWASVYAVAAGVAFAVAGPWVVSFFFGDEYAPVYMLTLILVSGHAVNVSFGPLGILLNMTGHQNYTLVASILSLITNLVLNYFLITAWGANGAAVATAASLIISKTITLIFVHRLSLLR